MRGSRTLRRAGICVALIAALGAVIFAGSAAAAAVPGTSYHQETQVGTDVNLCTGASGIVTNTITEAFHFVDMPNGTFHVELTMTQDYRTNWSDGTYVISHSVSHNEFDTSPSGEAEFTFAQQDRGTLYAADGTVLGYPTVFGEGHITWNNGTVVNSIFHFRYTCVS